MKSKKKKKTKRSKRDKYNLLDYDLYLKPIVRALELGVSRNNACYIAGIAYDTFLDRYRTDENFRNEVNKAEAKCEATLVSKLYKQAMRGNIKALTFMLERRFFKNWGKRDFVYNEIPEESIYKIDLDVFRESQQFIKKIQEFLYTSN